MPLLLLLLLVAGCSAPAHGTYAQAVGPAFPAPPITPPGTGAPLVGQPGEQAEEVPVPRSPHARVLPPTKEPGLWAGDEPQASRKRAPGPPVLLGVPLPSLSIGDEQFDEWPARACIAMWNEALPGTSLAEKVEALRPAEKKCMAALMFRDCALVIEELDDGSRKQGVVALRVRQTRAQMRQVADDFVREACKEIPLTEAQRRLLERLRAALRKSNLTAE